MPAKEQQDKINSLLSDFDSDNAAEFVTFVTFVSAIVFAVIKIFG